MNKTFLEDKIIQEFTSFVTSKEEPSNESSLKILNYIEKKFSPSSTIVFTKLLISAGITGLLSLIICPQFGLGKHLIVMRYFMAFGHKICALACGSIFVSLGILVAVSLLSLEELRVLRNHKFLQLTSYILLSLFAFACAGGEVLSEVALLWAFGGIVSSSAVVELGWLIRGARVV